MGKPQREVEAFREELNELRRALGQRIRELRIARGWSQEEFSDNAHIHRTFAGSLERGEKNVSFHALALIAQCFGISLSELFQGLESGEQPGPRTRRRARAGEIDRSRLLRELAVLERTVDNLRELASPTKRQPGSGGGRAKRGRS